MNTYIAQLTGPNGEEVTASRLGSGWKAKRLVAPYDEILLDKWKSNMKDYLSQSLSI